MWEKLFDGIWNSIPWIALTICIVMVSQCVKTMEENEKLNQDIFMESCRKDTIPEHKCILLWHNYQYSGVPHDQKG